MARCQICDCSDGHDNDYLHQTRRSGNRVRWNSKTREYLCDDCVNTIHQTMYYKKDAAGEADYTTNLFLFSHDSYSERTLVKEEPADD
jgi:uncharacterized protein YlaI